MYTCYTVFMNEKELKTDRINFRITKTLGKKFRIRLIEKGETQQQVFEEFVNQYVKS